MMGCVCYHEEVTLAHKKKKKENIHPGAEITHDLCIIKDKEIESELEILSQILQAQQTGSMIPANKGSTIHLILWLTSICHVIQFKGDHLHMKRHERTSAGGADGSDSLYGILVISLSDERYRENPSSLNTKEIQ